MNPVENIMHITSTEIIHFVQLTAGISERKTDAAF